MARSFAELSAAERVPSRSWASSPPCHCDDAFSLERPLATPNDLQMGVLATKIRKKMPQTVDMGEEVNKLAEDVEWGSR